MMKTLLIRPVRQSWNAYSEISVAPRGRSVVTLAVTVGFLVFLALADSSIFSAVRTAVLVAALVYIAVRAIQATPNEPSDDVKIARKVAQLLSDDGDVFVSRDGICQYCGNSLPPRRPTNARRR